MFPSLYCALAGELPCSGVAGGHAPVSRRRAPVPSVRATIGPWWTARPGPGPPRVDSVHGIIHCKIIHYSGLFQRFCKKIPRLLGNQPTVQILHSDPWFLKNNSKGVPSLRKIHKNSPETSKFHIFSTATPNLVILAPKLLQITSSFILCIHLTYVYCILLIDCMCLLHDM
jgi:hypothetical protein